MVYDPSVSGFLQALKTEETVTDTLIYTMQNSAGAEATGAITMTVTGRNDVPHVRDQRLWPRIEGMI